MLGRLLGVPDDDGPWLVERGDALLGNFDPEFTEHPLGLTDTDEFKAIPFRSPAALDLYRYAEQQAAERRSNPTDDVITDLLAPTIEGDQLTEQEFKNFFVLLVSAGNDTTRYTMAAGMKALIEHPDQLAELRDSIGKDPTLMDSAVEEILRWATVTMHFRRTATTDTELAGQRIAAGQKVVIWFVSADYDRTRFTEPYRFDIRRSAERPRGVRSHEPAPLPRFPTRPDGAQGAVRGAAAATRRRSHRRADRSAPVELHQRHEATAGGADRRVAVGDSSASV